MQRSTRVDLMADSPPLRWICSRLDPTSARGLVTLLAVIVVTLALLSIGPILEGRFALGSVAGPALSHPDLHVRGMSFVGDPMVWPFAIAIPILFAVLSVAVGRIQNLLARPGRILSSGWLDAHPDEYDAMKMNVAEIIHNSRLWRFVRYLSIALGLVFFAWNTISCAFPQRFRPYRATSVEVLVGDDFQEQSSDEEVTVPKWDTDLGDAPLSFFTARLWVLTLGYVWIPYIVYKLSHLVAAVYVLTKRFTDAEGALNVRPLSPDNAGGLAPLADVAVALTYPMFLLGVLMAMPFLKEAAGPSIHNVGLLVPFAPLLLIVFLIPLISVHDAMSGAKELHLARLSDLHEDVTERIVQVVRSGTADKPELERLETSVKLVGDSFGQVQRMPVWPFQRSVVMRLFAAAAIPLSIPILEEVIKAVLGRAGVL